MAYGQNATSCDPLTQAFRCLLTKCETNIHHAVHLLRFTLRKENESFCLTYIWLQHYAKCVHLKWLMLISCHLSIYLSIYLSFFFVLFCFVFLFSSFFFFVNVFGNVSYSFVLLFVCLFIYLFYIYFGSYIPLLLFFYPDPKKKQNKTSWGLTQ